MFNIHRTFELTTGVKNNALAVYNDHKETLVIYHKTPVFKKTGKTITLSNGGWDTVSTRIVINRALAQISNSLFLERRKGTTVFRDTQNNVVLPFVSPMKVTL